MKDGWQTCALYNVLEKTETIDPTRNPDKEFFYIDVSSVNNKTFRIEAVSELLGSEAPSRARKLVRTNDVIFATVRPTLKRIALVPEQYDQQVCSTGYFVLRGKEFIDNRFLFYFLQTGEVLETVEKVQKGASYPAITDSDVKGLRFSYPPIEEQRRIVAILDEAFDCIDKAKANTEKNIQNARELFDSYLNNIFSNPGPDWEETTLGEVCSFVGGSQPPKSVFTKTKNADSIRLIQIRDYKSDKHLVYIPRAKAKRFCNIEDVMIGRYGPPLFQILRGLEGAYNVALMKAVPNESRLSRDFLYHFLRNSEILRYVIFHSSRTAGQTGVTKDTLEPYPICFPSLAGQLTVVGTIRLLNDETKSLQSVHRSKIVELDELKKSILQKAFSGEI